MKIISIEYVIKGENSPLIKNVKDMSTDSIKDINSEGFWLTENDGTYKLFVDVETFSTKKKYKILHDLVYNVAIPYLKNGKKSVYS